MNVPITLFAQISDRGEGSPRVAIKAQAGEVTSDVLFWEYQRDGEAPEQAALRVLENMLSDDSTGRDLADLRRGPGLRVMINDGDAFVGVPYQPTDDAS